MSQNEGIYTGFKRYYRQPGNVRSKTSFFLTWFAYILTGILIITLIWAYFGEIEDYTKAIGTVRPGERISTIRNTVSGRVDEVYFEQGMRVKEGDVLYTIEIDVLIAEKEQLERKIDRLEKENSNLLKLKKVLWKTKTCLAVKMQMKLIFITDTGNTKLTG